ncbi:MAG TPA: hypothetical protein VK689_00740, partial [Armatimonadota bacterium]|nr:hypothetical protein [Armatimonadota bacterium]
MREELRELWRFRELLLMFVQRDLRVRYKNSILGFGWSLVNPLVQVATIAVVLQFLMRDKIESYYAYVFCAMLPWLFFNTAIMDGTQSLVAQYGLLRKTYFPREIIPIATVIANLIHFLLATAVFLVFMSLVPLYWWARTGTFNWPLLPTVLLLPIPMLGLTLLVAGVILFISVWTLYYEDVRFLADSVLKIAYWLVPVFYFAERFRKDLPGARGELLYTIYMLNPLSGFITAFRKLTMPPMKTLQENGSISVTAPMGASEWTF